MKKNGNINEVRIFKNELSHEEIKNNILDKAVNIYSINNLIGKKCKLYDLKREDGEIMIVTSETTNEEIERWADGQNAYHAGFYNQANQEEESIKIEGMSDDKE